ncbi:MAG TPA: hypothetical protein VJQ81_17895 [Reyranella sp.]|jgi:hypothetical protein|nr:hypothetical protein [Reyranella sp.]
MERFLASPYCKIIVLCFVLLVLLGFGYHVAHNLRLARQYAPAPQADIANAPPLSR